MVEQIKYIFIQMLRTVFTFSEKYMLSCVTQM